MRSSFTTALLLAAAVCHAAPQYAAPQYGNEVPTPAVDAYATTAVPTVAPAVVGYSGEPTVAPVVDSTPVGTYSGAPEPAVAPIVDSPTTGTYSGAPEPTVAPATGDYGSPAPGVAAPVPDVAPAYSGETQPPVAPAVPEPYSGAPEQPMATSTPDSAYTGQPAEPAVSGDAYNSTMTGAYGSVNGTESATWEAPKKYECKVSSAGFEPKEMTVKRGDTVMFMMPKEKSEYGIRMGKDATSCKPVPADSLKLQNKLESTNEPSATDMSTMVYTIPMDATGKMMFYNVKGDTCTDADMSASFTIADNLAAGNVTVGNSTTNSNSTVGIKFSSASSSVPMVALIGAVSFVSSLLQL